MAEAGTERSSGVVGDAGRTLPSLAGVDRLLGGSEVPPPASFGRCLDASGRRNLCPAGFADSRRATGEAFYDSGLCRMANRTSLLLLEKALEGRPGLEARVRRGAFVTRVRRDGRRLLVTAPGAAAPLALDPRAPLTVA